MFYGQRVRLSKVVASLNKGKSSFAFSFYLKGCLKGLGSFRFFTVTSGSSHSFRALFLSGIKERSLLQGNKRSVALPLWPYHRSLKLVEGHKQWIMRINSMQREEPYQGLTCQEYSRNGLVPFPSGIGAWTQMVHGCRQLVT